MRTCSGLTTCVATAALLLLLQPAEGAWYAPQMYTRRRVIYRIPPTTTPTATEAPEDAPKQIPLELVRRLSEVENITQFIENFIDKNSISTEDDFLASRFGESDERKAVQYAKQAVCKPELQTVQLYPTDNPLEVPYPSCTRIEKCGGCCGHSLLSCQPTDSEIVNFQVYIAEYKGGNLLQQQRKDVVPIERHLKCKCSCITKEENCNSLQKYVPNECACTCQNTDVEEKCKNQQNTKLWDPHECTCKCRTPRDCTTGYYFDQDICSCQPNNRRTTIDELPGTKLVW